MSKSGKDATEPYRVRAGGVWYWVDPTFPVDAIEAGDTVVAYPVNGDAVVVILQGRTTGGRVRLDVCNAARRTLRGCRA